MSDLQNQVLDRINQDIKIKTNNEEDNLLNTRLQQSVEELNVIIQLLLSLPSQTFFYLVNYERLCKTN